MAPTGLDIAAAKAELDEIRNRILGWQHELEQPERTEVRAAAVDIASAEDALDLILDRRRDAVGGQVEGFE